MGGLPGAWERLAKRCRSAVRGIVPTRGAESHEMRGVGKTNPAEVGQEVQVLGLVPRYD